MTEIERFVETSHLPSRPEVGSLPALGAGVVALQQWAETAQAAGSLINQIVDTPFFPAALMPKLTAGSDEARARQRAGAVANGVGAVLSGVEIGLSPMQALNNVLVIHGRPSLYAETMVALVQAAGHHIWCVESTETRAVVYGQRVNDPPGTPPRVGEMTIERAKKAGYVAKNPKYLSDPVAMLYARAASIACRRTAPEVLKGIPAFEEIQDDRTTPKPAAPAVAAPPVTAAEITGAPEPPSPAGAEPPPVERPLTERAAMLVTWFAGKWQVPAEALAARVGRPVDQWTDDDVALLRNIGGLLSQGQISVGDEFTPADDASPAADPDAGAPPVGALSNTQRSRLFAQLGELGVTDRAVRLRVVGRMVGRRLGSFNDLTAEEADMVAHDLAYFIEAGGEGAVQFAALTTDDQDGGQA